MAKQNWYPITVKHVLKIKWKTKTESLSLEAWFLNRIRLYGSTGLTMNRSLLRFFKP